jgi:hypothetical protein
MLLFCILVWLLWDFTRTEGWHSEAQRLLLISIVALPSSMTAMTLGTFIPFSTICLVLFYRALRTHKDYQAGLWFVLGSVKPQIIFLHGFVLLATKRWRAIGVVITLMLVIFIVTGLILGWDVWGEFLRVLSFSGHQFGTFGIHPTGMYNLKGTLTLWLGSTNATTINRLSWLGLGLICAFTYWGWHKQHLIEHEAGIVRELDSAFTHNSAECATMQSKALEPYHRAFFDLSVSLTTVLGILFGPHVNKPDAMLLAIPILLFYNYLHLQDKSTYIWLALSLCYPLIFLMDKFVIGAKLGIRVPVLILFFLSVWLSKIWYTEYRDRISA